MKTEALAGVSQSYAFEAGTILHHPLTPATASGQRTMIDAMRSVPPLLEPSTLLASLDELPQLSAAAETGLSGAEAIEAMLAYALDRGLVDGISIGLFVNGRSYLRIVGRGVTPASRFEIGSLTKLYTAELLRAMVEAGLVGWDDPVTGYLSKQLKAFGNFVHDDRSITLLDLAMHWSGLPGLPPNLRVLEGPNPFGHYNVAALERFLAKESLERPAERRFAYSNLGYGVLGYALENATGSCFAELLQKHVLEPLMLEESELAITGVTLPRIVEGHKQGGRVTPQWSQLALAPAGALCSSVGDQLRFIDHLLGRPRESTFAIFSDDHQTKTGLGWEVNAAGDLFERDSMTDGFCSYIGIKPGLGTGVVVLANRNAQPLIRAIAKGIEDGLKGLPVIRLEGDYGKFRAALRESIRPRGSVERMLRKVRLGVGNVLRPEI